MSKRQKTTVDDRSGTASSRTHRTPAVSVPFGPVTPAASKVVSLLIVEDDELMRAMISSYVSRVPGVRVVGDAANGLEALIMVEELRPNLVLTDIRMPNLDGIALTRELRQRYAHVAVVILTAFAFDEYLARALEAGARGFLLKSSGAHELDMAIRAVVNGNAYVTPAMSNALVPESLWESPIAYIRPRLTPRQRETLQLIAQGKTNKEIAAGLNVTVKTVEKHRSELMRRLDVRKSADLVRFALDHGLI